MNRDTWVATAVPPDTYREKLNADLDKLESATSAYEENGSEKARDAADIAGAQATAHVNDITRESYIRMVQADRNRQTT